MDSEELEINNSKEFNRLMKKISSNCRECSGIGFVIGKGSKASECSVCYPKVRTYLYIKNSGISTEDIARVREMDKVPEQLMASRILALTSPQNKLREDTGFRILIEEARLGRKVKYCPLPELLSNLKKGNNEITGYDTVFIDSIDLYRNVDNFLVSSYDNVLFHFKSNPKKKLIIGCHLLVDGYASRFSEIFGTLARIHYVV